jgi:glycosyltransferase involved in cell wall biosynthesis
MMNVISFQAFPNVRDYQLNAAIAKYDPEIRISVLAETPSYSDVFEKMSHPFVAPPRFWRSKPKNFLGKLWYHFFDERFSGPKLAKIVRQIGADLIHSHNFNHLGYYAIRYTDVPVIHDVSDFYSIFPRNQEMQSSSGMSLWARYKHRRELQWEKVVFENAAGLTFQSPYYLDVAEARYNVRCETTVIPNAILGDDLPQKGLPKLSEQDGQVHTVFVGHINRLKLDRVKEIAGRGVPVHLYTFHSPVFEPLLLAECNAHKYLYHHGALPRRELLLALTQYDFGLVLWYRGATEPFFDAVLPSKMFYYLASGLPVIVAPYRSISEFVLSRGCGFVLTHIDELEDKIHKRYTVGDRAQYTVEYYIPELARLYRELV